MDEDVVGTVPDKERIAFWVEALRSGRFEQGRGYLNAYGKLCCLGVACEVAIENGLDLERQGCSNPKCDCTDTKAYNSEVSVLPLAVMEWLGLEETNPLVHPDVNNPELVTLLAELNDRHYWSFAQIADLLEREYLS